MREKERDKKRIEDIITYSENVVKLAYMLSKDFKDTHSKTPWSVIQEMRHVLVHDYATVVPKILWATAKNDIPVILKQAQRY